MFEACYEIQNRGSEELHIGQLNIAVDCLYRFKDTIEKLCVVLYNV